MNFRAFAAAIALAATFITSQSALAGDIQITQPWARASAGMAKAGAAFLAVQNTGATDDRLVAARADVSKKVELHTHIKEGDLMKMRQVMAIDVPAGKTVALQPGGLHVMFMGLKAPLKTGAHFPLTLVFEKAGEITVDVEVQGVSSKMPMQHQHKNMQMKKTQ
ncbi:copper chaperone PCu(A)C [Thalassospiraceae bacterium LMO-JJ14]|nr:copper chaperone PCu(A)C [Thalassospiraceae bacterium LMO-JJ14]